MKRWFFWMSTLTLVAFLLQSCNKRVTNSSDQPPPDSTRIQIPRFGGDDSLEIAAWNIEWFPKRGSTTVRDVAEIMRDLDIDLYAMEEIADTSAFRTLLTELGEYDGFYSSDIYAFGQYQKTAVVYRKGLIQVSNIKNLFENDDYAFPRPPLYSYVVAQRNGKRFDFNFIVVHLKASDRPENEKENEKRRRAACQKLESYIRTQTAAGADPDWIVAGDWNDVLTDPDDHNVFKVFLDAPQDYTFLTWGIAQDPNNNATYIGGSYRSVIDHILVTAHVMPIYNSGTTTVLKIDQYFSAYVAEVSDHRPVAAIFPIFR